MMLAAGMGYPRGLLQLLLVLTFTAVGTQAHCGSDEISQMRPCVSPHMRKLLPLIRAFCDRDLITQDLCNVFKQIKDCASRKNIEACVEYNVFEELSESGDGYSCDLMDFQDKCGNATMIKKKTTTGRKARPSKETADETEDSEETAEETEDSEETAEETEDSEETAEETEDSEETATGRKAKPSKGTATGRKAKPSKGAASTSRASLVMVLVFTICLLLMSM